MFTVQSLSQRIASLSPQQAGELITTLRKAADTIYLAMQAKGWWIDKDGNPSYIPDLPSARIATILNFMYERKSKQSGDMDTLLRASPAYSWLFWTLADRNGLTEPFRLRDVPGLGFFRRLSSDGYYKLLPLPERPNGTDISIEEIKLAIGEYDIEIESEA